MPRSKNLTGLASEIARAFDAHYYRGSSKTGRRFTATNIVSEQVCDDLIAYLAPTLEQHKGASIIDINPGACLWSRKLHAFLQPKCHLLMEPERAYYEPFIKPLLEEPGSKYTYTNLAGAHPRAYFANYTTILNDPKLLPPRPQLEVGDPRLRQFDPSLLVIGNLKREFTQTQSVGFAPLILQHMTYAALSNEIFQGSGLVRMLWWVGESRHLKDLGYESSRSRASLNMQMETGASCVQIAGTDTFSFRDEKSFTLRPAAMQRRVDEQVQRRMDAAGLRVPNRCEIMRTVPADSPLDTLNGPNPLDLDCSSFSDLIDRVTAFGKHVEVAQEYTKSGGKKYTWTNASEALLQRAKEVSGLVKYSQCPELCRTFGRYELFSSGTRDVKPVLLLDLNLRMINLEANYSELAEKYPDDPKKETAYQMLMEAGRACDAQSAAAPLGLVEMAEMLTEHVHAYYVAPAVLQRDERPLHPLRITEAAFYPETKMTLLDLRPHEEDFNLGDLATNKQGAQICQMLCRSLWCSPQQPMLKTLNSVAINAGKDLFEMVPDLTDARKGGRLNPHKMRPRMLSVSSMRQLVKAFIEWPFAPPMWQLSLATESQIGDTARKGVDAEIDLE